MPKVYSAMKLFWGTLEASLGHLFLIEVVFSLEILGDFEIHLFLFEVFSALRFGGQKIDFLAPKPQS